MLFSLCWQNIFEVNQTDVEEFLFLGFHNLQKCYPLLFVLFLFIYVLTLAGNLLIIILVPTVPSLRSPMYFFLTQLSLSDILLTTNKAPIMLHALLNGGRSLSLTGCIAQLFFYGVSTTVECLLLTMMSYDRYLAICHPLHYNIIMDAKVQTQLVTCSWLITIMLMCLIVSFLCKLEFCGPQVIDQYLCDFSPILDLSCSDHTAVDIVYFVSALFFGVTPFFFIVFTYICILITIRGISSTSGKQKSFSTCSSHLIVVTTYYGTLTFVYMVPTNPQTSNVNKILTLLYNTGTPFFNPLIYSLRNHDIKAALKKYLSIDNFKLNIF